VTTRLNWEAVRDIIEERVGPIHAAEPVAEGLNSEIAVVVRTAEGATFVKGLRADHPRVFTQEREKTINPFIRHISAPLRWSAVSDRWSLLGFKHLDGRPVDYAPGSPDLAKVVGSMRQLQQIPCPDLPMMTAQGRWKSYTPTPELFVGDCLLHTEWSPGNVLVNEQARFVDWAWPTRGAAWIDPACWAVWLIASGHTPPEAEAWAAWIPSWNEAPRDAVDEFARTQAAMWAGIAEADPQPWTQRLAESGQAWAKHRGR
jgi:hypothetical protein